MKATNRTPFPSIGSLKYAHRVHGNFCFSKSGITNMIRVIRETHEAEASICEGVARAGGMNRFGEANFRVVWGGHGSHGLAGDGRTATRMGM